jgi:hypothetical protein
MSVRSLIIGFLLGLFVAAFTYFNDQVIRQTFFVGNHLPYSVFGLFVLLVLVVNPLLRRFKAHLALRPAELAVVVALGLAACLWPGAGLMRCFTTFVALPGSQYETKSTWKSVQALSYVPGGSPHVAEGFVRDWMALARGLAAGSAPGRQHTPSGRFWQFLPLDGRQAIAKAAASGTLEQSDRSLVVDALNRCIDERRLYEPSAFAALPPDARRRSALACLERDSCTDREVQRANRLLLEATLPGVVLPVPAGDGVLLTNGDATAPAAAWLMQGWQGSRPPSLLTLPWAAWWPTIAFWGGLVLLLALASLCVVIIVQPQWKREMLPYPIARFVQELSETEANGRLPKVAHSKLFWYGLGSMLILHLVNGLFAWFPNSIEITTHWNFMQLATSPGLPTAFFTAAHSFFIEPHIYPTLIAFMFFLDTRVSFSAGLSVVVFAVLSSVLAANGIAVVAGDNPLPGNVNSLRFGSYVACAVMLVYVGRRYYLNVAASSLGLLRHAETPLAAVWAFRALLVCLVLSVVVLARNSLGWDLGLELVLAYLVMLLGLTRLNAETGIFFCKPGFLPLLPFLAVLGVESLGPVAFFVLLIVSSVLAGDLRENWMAFLGNSVYMTTSREGALPSKHTLWSIALMVGVALAVAFGATLLLQYSRGLPYADGFASGEPAKMMDSFVSKLSDLSAYDQLSPSMAMHGLGRLLHAKPVAGAIEWIAAGFLLYAGCSFMRMRFVWWPIHPVLFLVLGTFFPSDALSFSILLGWLCKSLTVRFAGAKGYHTVKPLMFGLISGELLAALGWSVAGAIYFWMTGLIPKPYAIFYG